MKDPTQLAEEAAEKAYAAIQDDDDMRPTLEILKEHFNEALKEQCEYYGYIMPFVRTKDRAAQASEERHHYSQHPNGGCCDCGRPIDHPIHIQYEAAEAENVAMRMQEDGYIKQRDVRDVTVRINAAIEKARDAWKSELIEWCKQYESRAAQASEDEPRSAGLREYVRKHRAAQARESIAEKAKRKGWTKPLHSVGSWLRDYRHTDQNLSKEN